MRKFLILLAIITALIIFIYAISGRSSPDEVVATLEEIEEQFGNKNLLKLDGNDFFLTPESKLVNEVSTYKENGITFLKLRTIKGEIEVSINLSKECYEKYGKSYIYGILSVDNVDFFVQYASAYDIVKYKRFLSTDY